MIVLALEGLETGKYRYIYYQLLEFNNRAFADPYTEREVDHAPFQVPEAYSNWERSPELNGTVLHLWVSWLDGIARKGFWRTTINLAAFKPSKIWIRNTDVNYALECQGKFVRVACVSVPDSYLRVIAGGNRIFDQKISYNEGTYRLNQWDANIDVSEYNELVVEVAQKDGAYIPGGLQDFVGGVKLSLAYTPINMLSARVIDENKQPIYGAMVRVYEMDKVVLVAEGVDGDYDGVVTFDLDAGKYWVKAYSGDRQSEWTLADLVEDKTLTLSIGLGSEYWFSTIVVSRYDYPPWNIRAGEPVSGARVRLIKDTSTFYDDTTDETGVTPDKRVVGGTYTLSVEKSEWKLHSETIGLTSDRTGYRIELEHEPAVYYTMVVSVADDSVPPRPIAGADVAVSDGSGDSGSTDAFGKYRTTPLLKGHYYVSATYAGITGNSECDLDREAKEAKVTVPLSGLTHTLIAVVMDSTSGQPVPMVRADFYKTGALVTTLFTDSKGQIVAEISEGAYTITFSKKGYAAKDRSLDLFQDISFIETLDAIPPVPPWALPATIIGTVAVVAGITYAKRGAIQARYRELRERL